jgi:hypothetical protein
MTGCEGLIPARYNVRCDALSEFPDVVGCRFGVIEQARHGLAKEFLFADLFRVDVALEDGDGLGQPVDRCILLLSDAGHLKDELL